MAWQDEEEIISIRKCDIHSVLMMLSLGNKEAVKEAENTIMMLAQKSHKGGK